MEKVRISLVRADAHDHSLSLCILAVRGALLGLGYILFFPFIGLASFVVASGYRAKLSLSSLWGREIQAEGDIQEGVGYGLESVTDLLQPLVDRLNCEYIVVDKELYITQYITPASLRNKRLEKTAIGRHCFEVSHGRNKPCELPEHQCPIRTVVKANEPVIVTHYHRQFGGKGKQRLVKVLASPVRDSHNNITHFTELIWDADNVN